MTRVVIYSDKSPIQVKVAHKKSLLFFKLQEYKIPPLQTINMKIRQQKISKLSIAYHYDKAYWETRCIFYYRPYILSHGHLRPSNTTQHLLKIRLGYKQYLLFFNL